MKAFLIYAFMFCCGMLLSRQGIAQTLHGAVKDSVGKLVPFAGVNLKGSDNSIIAYTVSNDKGIYSIQIPADADKTGLVLEASCIGYARKAIPVTSNNLVYNFALHVATNMLKTVVVKDNHPRLRVSGDTLNYKVSDFSSPQDRVIGDVIKKIPGIDVDANGKIKYNGKAISNLYIGGDNLLDDKYNIATSTIPNGAVDNIQVMENHQPIKMLNGKVPSDDVALNLTIKPGAKVQLLGKATLGAGLPGKYDEDINVMALKDKYKAINYIKGNNTGNDVSYDVISHNMDDYLKRIDNNKPTTVLSLGAAGNPNLPTSRYLFNQSALLNLNNLVNLRKDVQLKMNISYLHDIQRQEYSKIQQTFLPGDTITYTETQHNKTRPDLLHTQFNININNDKYYLNDALIGNLDYHSNYSDLITNSTGANQHLKDNAYDFSNELNFMQTLKSGLVVNLYSYINRMAEPEDLVIAPGLNADIFNGGQAYSQLIQHANIPTWVTNNYFSFRLPGNLISQAYKAGFNIQSQQFESTLYTVQTNNTIHAALDSAVNDLDWQRKKIYGDASYSVNGKKLTMNVDLPLTLLQASYKEAAYQLDQSLTRLYVDPQVSIKYMTGLENFVTLSYNYKNNIGDINDVYRGYVLKNYRSLYANNAGLTESNMQSAGLGYNYRKATQMFFFNVYMRYNRTSANNIAFNNITTNFQQRIVLPYQNTTDGWMAGANVSKYNFDLHTTFGAGAAWQSNHSNQILNGVLLPYKTQSTGLNGSVDTKVSNAINISYKIFFTHTSSASSVASGSSFNQLQHQAAINYIPTNSLMFKLSGDNFFTHQPNMNDLNYSFADFSARYIFTKRKIDLELTALNLLNTKTYSTAYLSANAYTYSEYKIPGRMILAKVTFDY